jgi:hypothetical protein
MKNSATTNNQNNTNNSNQNNNSNDHYDFEIYTNDGWWKCHLYYCGSIKKVSKVENSEKVFN